MGINNKQYTSTLIFNEFHFMLGITNNTKTCVQYRQTSMDEYFHHFVEEEDGEKHHHHNKSLEI